MPGPPQEPSSTDPKASVRRIKADDLCPSCCERVHSGEKMVAPSRVAYEIDRDGVKTRLCYEHTYAETGRG